MKSEIPTYGGVSALILDELCNGMAGLADFRKKNFRVHAYAKITKITQSLMFRLHFLGNNLTLVAESTCSTILEHFSVGTKNYDVGEITLIYINA